jgi:hypothetical protein
MNPISPVQGTWPGVNKDNGCSRWKLLPAEQLIYACSDPQQELVS